MQTRTLRLLPVAPVAVAFGLALCPAALPGHLGSLVGIRAALAQGSPVIITAARTVNADDLTLEDQDIIVRGAVLTVNGPHRFRSLTLENNATVTHSARSDANFLNGLELAITNDARVNNGSTISASGRGWSAGLGPGAGTSNTVGGRSGGGGSYGGSGNSSGDAAGDIYGDLRQPLALGSGGGNGHNGVNAGGAGGGAVRLTVGGTLTVDGRIEANGSSVYRAGGGSGGSILLNVGTLAGGGIITANGGDDTGEHWAGTGGAGGGGRIAVYYTNLFINRNNLSASGGAGGNPGPAAAGTVFFKDPFQSNGDLQIGNNNRDGLPTFLPEGLNEFDNLRLWNRGRLGHSRQGLLHLSIIGNALIEDGSAINANGQGYAGSLGPGAGTNNSGGGSGGGGSFGGEGGATAGGLAGVGYGDIRDPNGSALMSQGRHVGSGGGSGHNGAYAGGSGGGAVRMTVGGTLTVDGRIEANGVSVYRAGGGSGGSILLNVGTLAGGGIITANGGDDTGEHWAGTGGAGGGGRIAAYYNVLQFPRLNLRVYGGRSANVNAGSGTVFLKQTQQTNGELYLDNNGVAPSGRGTVLQGPHVFDAVTILNSAALVPPPLERLELTVTGDLNVTGGVISANGRGHTNSTGGNPGPGAGSNNANGGGAGGSHGGRGTSGRFGASVSGPTYGDAGLPLDLGSGGGFGYNSATGNPGGAGGGAIRLTVNGTLRMDGNITADGNNGGGSHGGGGAGGSILIRAGLLTGGGFINANGGFGPNDGGGGGGGRIALYAAVNNLPAANVTANGGRANNSQINAANGTIERQSTNENLTASLVLTPSALAGGLAATGQVTLSGPAPENGLTIALTNSNPLALTVPPSVSLAAGETSALFTATAASVTSTQTATVGARLWDQLATQNVTVRPWLSELTINPTSVTGGTTASGILRLAVPAPAGGLTVDLSSNDPAVVVPPSIRIPGGATTHVSPFPVAVGTVSAAKQASVTAAYLAERRTVGLFVNPGGAAQVSSVTPSPASVLGGNRAFGVVVLTGRAPTGGSLVALRSADAAVAAVPVSVLVPAGRTSASFPITTRTVATTRSVRIDATLGTTASTTITVSVPGVATLELIPAAVKGGDTSIGVVTLSGPSATPVTVTISSDNGAAVPETSIVIPAGQTTGTFFIDTGAVASATAARITARAGGVGKSQTLQVNP